MEKEIEREAFVGQEKEAKEAEKTSNIKEVIIIGSDRCSTEYGRWAAQLAKGNMFRDKEVEKAFDAMRGVNPVLAEFIRALLDGNWYTEEDYINEFGESWK